MVGRDYQMILANTPQPNTVHFHAKKTTNTKDNEWKKRRIIFKETIGTILKPSYRSTMSERLPQFPPNIPETKKIPTSKLFHNWLLWRPLPFTCR